MNKSRIQIARPDIIRYFDELPSKVLHHADLARILNEQRTFWRLTLDTSTTTFIRFLIDSGKLSVFEFPFPKPYKKKTVYAWGPAHFYEVVLGISSKCYFSHYSAVKIHGLTEQTPKTFYVNEEQRLESWLAGKLTQTTIDAAFRRPVRVTSRVAETKEYRVIFLNGKNTANLGVVEEKFKGSERFGRIRVTNVERTLIDITVRPVYSGGVAESAAFDKSVNFAKVAEAMGCVGFRVEKAADMKPALDKALAAGRPAIVEVLGNAAIRAKRGWVPAGISGE